VNSRAKRDIAPLIMVNWTLFGLGGDARASLVADGGAGTCVALECAGAYIAVN
jgi:hypothetical protein